MEPLKRIQKIAFIIPLIFISGYFVSNFAESFRGNENLHWIYTNGKDLAMIMWYGSVAWSIINSILILRNLKIKTQQKVLWFVFSMVTFIYFAVKFTIAMTRNVC